MRVRGVHAASRRQEGPQDPSAGLAALVPFSGFCGSDREVMRVDDESPLGPVLIDTGTVLSSSLQRKDGRTSQYDIRAGGVDEALSRSLVYR